MNLPLFVQWCGVVFFVVVILTATVLSIAACVLAFVTKKADLLTAFLPLTLTPFAIAASTTLIDLASSIATQLDADSAAIDPALLLQLNLMQLLVGVVATIPAATITILGRLLLLLGASGVVLVRKRENVNEGPAKFTAEEWVNRETNDYLEKLVRQR